MLQLFEHYVGITDKSRKNRFFHRFLDFWPWSRNNYLIIPTTCSFPANFTRKNYMSELNFEKKKFSIFDRGLRFGLKIAKTTIFGRRMEFFFFFLFKRKFIIAFFGVNFTVDYPNVAIIPTLCRDHRQKSKKPIFSSFFLLLTVIPK